MQYTEAMRMARESKGMLQSEVAKQLGVATNSVSRWENGDTVPNAINLIKLGETYGVTLDQLCGLKPLA